MTASPNPFSDEIRLNIQVFDYEAGFITVSIFDVACREVLHTGFDAESGANTVTFDASDLDSGIYFLNWSTSITSGSEKIIKN